VKLLGGLVVGNDSLGKIPYKRRPRKSPADKRAMAKAKPQLIDTMAMMSESGVSNVANATVAEPKRTPAKPKPAAKRTPAKPKPTVSSVADSAKDLDPSRRTTTDERRAVLLAALRLASSLADDPSMPPSARTGALTNARQLLAQLQAENALDPRKPLSWGSVPVVAK